MLYRLIEWF